MVESLTDAEMTVLGLLAEQPRHGYDLDKVIAERGVREWTSVGFSSIYYLLDKLAARDLIAPTTQAGRRTVFGLTEHGHWLLAAQALEALATLTPVRGRVLPAIAALARLDDPQVRAGLEARRTALRAELDRLAATRADQEPLPPQAAAIFDYGAAMLRADLGWTDTLLDNTEKGARP